MRKGLTTLAALALVVNGFGGVPVKAEAPGTTPAAVERVMPRLVVGQEKAATIEGNEKQIYDIPMENGQYLELIVEQKNVDVIVTLFDPQGKQVMESDFAGRSEEFVLFIAEQTGNYRLQVRRYEQDAIRGDYGVQVVAVRSASQSDKAKASAYQSGSQALAEGLELLKAGQPASSQQALTKFKTALSSFQGLQQPAVIGVALKLIGDSYSSLKEYPQALDAYQQALSNHRQANELVGEAYALQGIGAVYSALGNNIKASEYILSVLDLYPKIPGRLWDLRGALQQLAVIYRESEKYAQAVTVLEEVLLLDRQLKDNQGEGLTLYVLGMTYKDVGQNQEAINAYEQSLKIYQQLGQKDEQKAILEALADIYQRQGNQATAEDYQRQALAMTDQPKKIDPSPPSEAQKLLDEGMQLFNLGTAESRQQAIKTWEAALLLWRKTGDKVNEATTLTNIGAVYSGLGEKQKALDYYQLALPLRRATGDRSGEARSLLNIGAVYSDLGEKKQALDYFQQALLLTRAVSDRKGEATTLNNIGRVYDELGEKQKALDYYSQALPLSKAVGDHAGEAVTLTNIGAVYSGLGEKQKALDYFQQALPILNAVGDRRVEATTLNNIGSVYSGLGEKQKALDYFQQALPILNAVGDRRVEATTLTNIGLVYSDLGEKQKALDYYSKALPLRKAVNDRSGEATTLNNIGAVYSALGEKQKALEYYSQALPLFKAVGDRGGEAGTLNNIGLVYSDLGEKQKALDYFQQALPILKAVGDRSGEATTLNNIGAVYSALGEKQKALDYYSQALSLRRAVGDRSGEATTLNGIGAVYDSFGEPQKALDYFSQAILLGKAVGDRNVEATALNNTASVNLVLGDVQKALSNLTESLALRKALGDRQGEVTVLGNIGVLYSRLGVNRKALEYHKQALSLSKELGDQFGEAYSLNNIASSYLDIGEVKTALDYYEESLSLSKKIDYRANEGETLSNIGYLYGTLGDYLRGLEYYTQSLTVVGSGLVSRVGTLQNIGTSYIYLGENQKALDYFRQALVLLKDTSAPREELVILSNIASLEQRRGNLQAALKTIQASIAIVEELRAKIIDPDLRQSYFATVQDIYQLYIELLMELHQQNPSQGYDKQAFNISERSRARTLLELLTEASADIKEGVDPQLLAQEKSLLGQFDATEKRRIEINSNPKSNPEQKANIDKQYKDLQTQYQALQTQIRAKSPKYAALKYPQPLTLSQVQQQLLDPDTALLQYSLGKEKSYLWVVTQDGFQSYVLPASKDLKTTAENLLKLIQFDKDNAEGITQVANQLSQQILAPATNKLNKKRLIIVPDGVLNYVPFSVLTANNQPLISNHELTNLPSSSSLALIRQDTQNRKPAPKALAILADPIFSSDDTRLKTPQKPVAPANPDLNTLTLNRAAKVVKKNRAGGENNVFIRIAGTRQEANAILALLPKTETQAAFDDQANLPLATNPQLSQYRIIHLATHGIFNTQEPALSGIILSLVDQKGKPINGFLRLNDIFNLNLPAELVVLSACETGLGEEIKGEGLVGLTRGFMYAGTPRVLVSLWKVDDDATAEIMTRFYKLMLEKKLPPAQALRQAQLQMQKETEWKSPYYWSAFVLQGEWR